MGIEIGLRHSGYVESIVTIEEWVFGGRRGGAEGGLRVIARRKPLERIVERAGEFREGRAGVYIYFRLFLRVHHRKNHTWECTGS